MRGLNRTSSWPSTRRTIEVAFILIPFCVLCAIWFPVVSHFRVPQRTVAEGMIDAARLSPEDGVLEELDGFFALSINPKWETEEQLVTAAEEILRGRVDVPGFPVADLGIPLDAEDLEKPGTSLLLAGLSVPKILLDAYSVTRRDEFLLAAKDRIMAWARFEDAKLLPVGLLWNDHAIAARVQVLTQFWRFYRRHPEFQTNVARELLEWISRSGEMLARPSHFTFWSNHGFMQNLGLWNISVAFPSVPGTEDYKQLALERMSLQLEISAERGRGFSRAFVWLSGIRPFAH